MGGVIKSRGEALYKPPSTYVIDPLEYVAMGLHTMTKRDGENRWQKMKEARMVHPDWQKSALFAYGAVVHVHLFPERTAPGMRPPEDWLREAGITESSLAEAKKQLRDEDPDWEQKMMMRRSINEAMDGMETKQ